MGSGRARRRGNNRIDMFAGGSSDAVGSAAMPETLLSDAEDALQRGLVSDASGLAKNVLQHRTAAVADKSRAISILIQVEFHFNNQLADLEQLLRESEPELSLEQLPVTAVLLWGVVAVELQAVSPARALLSKYLRAKHFGEGSGVSREDALALSRLYAVQLLGGLCQDFQAAADWLQDGGAGLSDEQLELLLLEIDEAEELAQEEHVAVWTSQDAAQAAQFADAIHTFNSNSSGTTAAAGDTDSQAAAGGDSHYASHSLQQQQQEHHDSSINDKEETGSAVGSVASTAVAAAVRDLGPSISGVLSACSSSLAPSGEPSHEHAHEHDMVHEPHEHQAELMTVVHGHEHGCAPEVDAASSREQQQQQQQQGGSSSSGSNAPRQTPVAAAAAAAGAQVEAAVAAVEAAHARLWGSQGAAAATAQPPPAPVSPTAAVSPAAVAVVAAVGVRGFEECEPSSPSLAAWRRSPDEAAVPDQGSQGGVSDNPFVTITGAFNNQGYDVSAVAAVAAAPGAVVHSDSGSMGSSPPSRKGSKMQHSSSSKLLQGPTAEAAVTPAAEADTAAAAVDYFKVTEVTAVEQGPKQQQQQHGEAHAEFKQQQQQQSWLVSYTSWASSKTNEAWESAAVQDTLTALNLQDVPPLELAAGAAAAAVLGYTLYRNRRRARRAAADFAAGVGQMVQMGLGLSALNPMAAVPGTGHLSR